MINFDVVIIGSGLAGLSTALKLADNKKIAIISKRALDDSSSQWAQGGIASSSSQFDSYKSHIQDTINAGSGLCDEKVTDFEANERVETLNSLNKNVEKFTKEAKKSK